MEYDICPMCKKAYEYKYTDSTEVYYHEDYFCITEPHRWVFADGKQLTTRTYDNKISKYIEVES